MVLLGVSSRFVKTKNPSKKILGFFTEAKKHELKLHAPYMGRCRFVPRLLQ